MSDTPRILPRDCYSSLEVRRLFARRGTDGKLVLMHRCTLERWRTKGRIQFLKINRTCFVYPKVDVLRLLDEMNEGVTHA